jgi:hypothetical protein
MVFPVLTEVRVSDRHPRGEVKAFADHVVHNRSVRHSWSAATHRSTIEGRELNPSDARAMRWFITQEPNFEIVSICAGSHGNRFQSFHQTEVELMIQT